MSFGEKRCRALIIFMRNALIPCSSGGTEDAPAFELATLDRSRVRPEIGIPFGPKLSIFEGRLSLT